MSQVENFAHAASGMAGNIYSKVKESQALEKAGVTENERAKLGEVDIASAQGRISDGRHGEAPKEWARAAGDPGHGESAVRVPAIAATHTIGRSHCLRPFAGPGRWITQARGQAPRLSARGPRCFELPSARGD